LFSRAFALWLSQWPTEENKRVTTVCAVQAAWIDASLRTIDWCAHEGLVSAVSASGYFGPTEELYDKWEKRGADLTSDEVLAGLQSVLEMQSRKSDSANQIAMHAKALGLPYLNYEGGQSLEPRGQQEASYMPALRAAQFHPRMYDLYVENLRQQKRLGSTLFCAYASVSAQGARWGSWGAKERYDSPNAQSPKYRALIDCNAASPVSSGRA